MYESTLFLYCYDRAFIISSWRPGSKDFIFKARRLRKAVGGGLRQVGVLAAAGLYALDHHIDRLQEREEVPFLGIVSIVFSDSGTLYECVLMCESGLTRRIMRMLRDWQLV